MNYFVNLTANQSGRERAPRSLSKAHVSHLPLHMSSATFSQDIPGVQFKYMCIRLQDLIRSLRTPHFGVIQSAVLCWLSKIAQGQALSNPKGNIRPLSVVIPILNQNNPIIHIRLTRLQWSLGSDSIPSPEVRSEVICI